MSSQDVLDEILRFYRECRIVGAPVEEGYNADELCIECGNDFRVKTPEIADYRGQGDVGNESQPAELQLAVRRIVHAVEALPEGSDFDEDGFEMVIELYYDPTADDSSFFFEVSTLEEFDREAPQLCQNPLVARLLTLVPTDTSAYVGGAG